MQIVWISKSAFKNAPTLAIRGVDTSEKEPSKVSETGVVHLSRRARGHSQGWLSKNEDAISANAAKLDEQKAFMEQNRVWVQVRIFEAAIRADLNCF